MVSDPGILVAAAVVVIVLANIENVGAGQRRTARQKSSCATLTVRFEYSNQGFECHSICMVRSLLWNEADMYIRY